MTEIRVELHHGAALRLGLEGPTNGPGWLAIDSKRAGTMLVDMTRTEAKDLIAAMVECWKISGLELDDLAAGL